MYSKYIPSIKGTEAEELYKTYNILLSDLITDDTVSRNFDGIEYYIHIKNGKKYIYDSLNNIWW